MRLGVDHFLFITLDTLRYDVAMAAWTQGQTPKLGAYLPADGWERRHSPATFTYAAHHAFFAGFLPTPSPPGTHPRRFTARFAGSETTTADTIVFDTPDIVSGFAQAGYATMCIGGVGFFNQLTPLGSILPGLFQNAYWAPHLGVTEPRSTEYQVATALEAMGQVPVGQPIFLFLNVSALHQPNYFYVEGAPHDSPTTQQAALAYVDSQLPPLFNALRQRGSTFAIVCADHGTAYGEDGYIGHRIAHPVVWEVPYAEFYL